MVSKIKPYRSLIIFLVVGVAVTILLVVLYKSVYFQELQTWSAQHKLIYFFVLTLIKIIGIIWPPLPGGTVTLASIPIIGWRLAYFADLVGGVAGCAIAFQITRTYGKRFLTYIVDEKSINKITNLKIKPKRQLEMLFIIFIFGGTVVEIVAYGCGLIKQVKLRNVILAKIASHILIALPTYYFADSVIRGENIAISIIAIVIFIPVLWKLRFRYLEL